MKRDIAYMFVAAAAVAAILYFRMIGTVHPPDAFMASLTLFVLAVVIIPLILRIAKESDQ